MSVCVSAGEAYIVLVAPVTVYKIGREPPVCYAHAHACQLSTQSHGQLEYIVIYDAPCSYIYARKGHFL